MPNPGPSNTTTTNSGTLSPKAAAEAAAHAGATGTTVASTGITGFSRGNDPVTGLPITTDVITTADAEAWFKKLKPDARLAYQKRLTKLGLYPQGYNPSSYLTETDLAVIGKVADAANQKGTADLNKVLDMAKTDKELRSFLQTGNQVSTGVSTTDTAAASSSLTSYYLDLFNDKPTKEELKAYQSTLNARERSAKGGLTSQEREDIMLSVANKRISDVSNKAIAGDVKSQQMLDTGALGRRVREIRQAYQDNGIPVADKTIYKLAGQSIRSQQAYETVLDDINNNTLTQWGQLATGLKPGQTVRSKLQPYISLKADIRGIPDDQIKVSDMTDVMNADGTFKKYGEYETLQYGSKDYLTSTKFKDVVRNDTQTLLANFGIK
jgi:hypothetical protein